LKDDFVDYGDAVFFINEGDDTTWIHEIQDNYDQRGLTSRLFYVPVDGCNDKYLHPHRFIVENYQHSLKNHMAWEGIFDSKDQMDFMVKTLREFQKTGKQLLVEEVNFDEEVPIYDYITR
jgi:hypothetical protein